MPFPSPGDLLPTKTWNLSKLLFEAAKPGSWILVFWFGRRRFGAGLFQGKVL